MFSGVCRRLSYANVVATLALVFAMSGGALAASKYLITSTKQIKPSVLSSLKGKPGANGAQGAVGATGSAGLVGGTGLQGPAGGPGAKGETGPEGKEGKTGKEGKAGLPGSPWTVDGTLPPKATETGVWVVTPTTVDPTNLAISFPIKLSAPLSQKGSAHFIETEGNEIDLNGKKVQSSTCKGTVAQPTAEPGNLCIYAAKLEKSTSEPNAITDPVLGGEGTVGSTGALFTVVASGQAGEERYEAQGTWAVTAE
jgi:hypothetical protein